MSSTLLPNYPEYGRAFVNYLKGDLTAAETLSMGYNTGISTYEAPTPMQASIYKAVKKASVFRNVSTVMSARNSGYRLLAKDADDLAQFVEEGGQIPIYEGIRDFTTKTVNAHKLAVFVKLDEDFVLDAAFDIEDYICKRVGKNTGRAEDKAFITGDGVKEPAGILHDTEGAQIGKTTGALTYDDVIELYFSVKPEYRSNGMWLMNDETALALRKLKDADGNYLWNSENDTILGKPVRISEFMPFVGAGAKPVAFGDFSYYWIIDRKPVSMRILTEKFAAFDQIGYLALEFLDGKLIRPDAVKVLQITA